MADQKENIYRCDRCDVAKVKGDVTPYHAGNANRARTAIDENTHTHMQIHFSVGFAKWCIISCTCYCAKPFQSFNLQRAMMQHVAIDQKKGKSPAHGIFMLFHFFRFLLFLDLGVCFEKKNPKEKGKLTRHSLRAESNPSCVPSARRANKCLMQKLSPFVIYPLVHGPA